MKKHLSLVLILLIGTCLVAQTAIQPAVGDGSEGNPYRISSLENLYWLQNAGFPGYSIQTVNINASETATWNSDGSGGYYGWEPLGVQDGSSGFTGSYDGQGFKIDSLYINRPLSQYVGFIGNSLGGTIKNLRLTNADITGLTFVGGMVGLGSINLENCTVSGNVEAVSGTVGGLVGKSNNGGGQTIQTCYSSATVTGSPAGGIVGDYYGSSILNCFAKGSVVSSSNGGGLIGLLSNSVIAYCYAAATVSNGGGLIAAAGSGGEEGGGNTVIDSYWDYEISGQFVSEGGMFASTAQMTTQELYSNWDFVNTWSIDGSINGGYPYLQSNLTEDALPITLSGFNAEFQNGHVEISWRTESETDNARFFIYRNGEVLASLEGAGTSSEPHDYLYIDNQVVPGNIYVYVLADLSYANDEVIHEEYAVTIEIKEYDLPQEFALEANYPNPFNPITVIPYSLPSEAYVKLDIYDIGGKHIRTLIDDMQSGGHYNITWNGLNDAGIEVNSGIYISRMTSDNFSKTRKMIFMK